ncbi:unnamed protein product, partial [marine sediment metagenome]
HSLQLADFNGDGHLDIFCGEMRLHGKNRDAKMWIFFGDGRGNFKKEILAVGFGVHEAKVADLDGDGDVDILGKPYDWETPRIDVWFNNIPRENKLSLDRWKRHVIDSQKPWRSVFITSADLDNDRRKDIITGGWWYKNPGNLGEKWVRYSFGSPLNNMAMTHDFDNDGDIDVLGTKGKGSEANAEFAWARNNGSGSFIILKNISGGEGDFLQGAAKIPHSQHENLRIALSWHRKGKGVQLLTVPSDPSTQRWGWQRISSVSQDEGLSAGDIDGDGDFDLMVGSKW